MEDSLVSRDTGEIQIKLAKGQNLYLRQDYSQTIAINQNLIDNIYPKFEPKTGSVISITNANGLTQEVSWFERTFAPLTPGSLRGSTITLMSTALGSGILSLPYVVAQTGLIMGIIFITLGAMFALLSMYLLMKASFRTGICKYSELVKHCFGSRISLFFELVIIIYAFGSITAYQITISKFVPNILVNLDMLDNEEDWSKGDGDSAIQIAIIALVAFPIALIRNLHGLRYGTMLGVFSVLYILGVVLVESIWEIPAQKKCPNLFNFSTSLISSYAITTFAYTCHLNIFPLRVELTRPMEQRMRKIFNRAVGIELFMYLGMGVMGYLSTVDNPVQLITSRAPISAFGNHDIFMLIGRIAMTLNLIIALPVNINPCRIQILNLLKSDNEFNYTKHFVITAILICGSAGVAFGYPEIASAFSILGGTCSTLLGITFPILIYVYINPDKWNTPQNLFMIIVACLMTILGFTGAVFSVINSSNPPAARTC